MTDFLTITSNDNWFKQHPEKIAGVEFETTSFYFPIQVKGTKDDVLRVTGIDKNTKVCEKNTKPCEKKHENNLDKLKLAQAKMKMAAAKLKLLQ